MALTLEDVEKIAKLSRLAMNSDEKQQYLADLNGIFAMIEKMQSVQTDDIEPLEHPHEVCQRLREDEVTSINQREKYQAIAPQVEQGWYLVPKVIDAE